MLAIALTALALPALADNPRAQDNAIQSDDKKIEACLTNARADANDVTAHDKRIVEANQCVCAQVPNLCNHGMIQDFRLRQRVLDDK
jgi:hypothetical protein